MLCSGCHGSMADIWMQGYRESAPGRTSGRCGQERQRREIEMENFIQALEHAAKGIQKFSEQLLSGLVAVLNRTWQAVIAITKRIDTYLTQLFTATWRLLVALSKLALPYLPGIIAFTLGMLGGHLWLALLGGGWIVFITIIGLTYKKKQDEDGPSAGAV